MFILENIYSLEITFWSIVAIEHPCHILDPINGGTISSRHVLDPLSSTQTLLGSFAYRYHDFAPPIRKRSPLKLTRHESAMSKIVNQREF